MTARKGWTVGLAAGAFIGWLLYRRWQRSFLTVEVNNVRVRDREGVVRTGRRVRVQSVFDAPPAAVWAKVTTPALLTHVTYPVLTFEPQNAEPLPQRWHEGESRHLKLFGFGHIPLGEHTIHIERIDDQRREIQSSESGRMAETWRHFISVQEYPNHQTLYTDEIDIYAAPLTGAVATFARLFYCYRQTRWRGVVKEIRAAAGAASTTAGAASTTAGAA